jgi:DNA-binding response OmpR family regulator
VKTHILVVEDEADIANLIKHSLERAPDFVVSVAASGDAAMKALSEESAGHQWHGHLPPGARLGTHRTVADHRVWGYDLGVETRSVDVHVGRLRAKLGTAGSQIATVVGLGYRFVE